jgi:hypothetical protein
LLKAILCPAGHPLTRDSTAVIEHQRIQTGTSWPTLLSRKRFRARQPSQILNDTVFIVIVCAWAIGDLLIGTGRAFRATPSSPNREDAEGTIYWAIVLVSRPCHDISLHKVLAFVFAPPCLLELLQFLCFVSICARVMIL